MAQVIDLTLPLSGGIPVYPGDPPFKLSVHADFSESGCRVSRVEMGLHTGTHVDLPLHYLPQGDDASILSPDRFIGDGVLLDCPKAAGQSVTVEDLGGCDIRPGSIVLIRTGWGSRAGTPALYEENWPGVGSEAVEALVAQGVKGIGVDTPSIDSAGFESGGFDSAGFDSAGFDSAQPAQARSLSEVETNSGVAGESGFDSAQPAHNIALGAGVPIYECLVNLGALVGRRFTFVGLPLRIAGAEACPVRAVAIIR